MGSVDASGLRERDGNLTDSTNLHWGKTSWGGQNFDQSFDYENNRIDQAGWSYDEDGRNVTSATFTGVTTRTFNAAGQMVRASTYTSDSRPIYDGNGAEIKREIDVLGEITWEPEPTKYYIRSSVLGGRVVSEAWANGRKHRSYVKGIGNQTAVQIAYAHETATPNETVLFEFSDSSGMSYRTTNKTGDLAASGDGGEGSPIETDPMGGSVGLYTPFVTLIIPYEPEHPELQPFNNNNLPTPNFSALYSTMGSRVADLPGFGTNWGSFSDLYMMVYEERLANSRAGFGFITNEQYIARANAQASATAAFAHEGGHSAIGRASNGRIVGDNESGGDETGGYGQWVDQSTGDVDLDTNTVTIRGGGYWDFSPSDNKPWYIVGFDENQKKVIQDQVKSMYSNTACAKAFEAAGLKSVKTMMDEGEMVVLREGALYSTHLWAGNSHLRDGFLAAFRSESVAGVSYAGGYDGRYYMVLRNSTFSRGVAVTTIIHELIHSASVNLSGHGSPEGYRIPLEDFVIVNPKTNKEIVRRKQFQTPSHDLDWMNYKDGKYTGTYDNIIKNCQPK